MACLIMPSNPYATTAKTTRQTTLTENSSHSLHWQTAAWSTEQNEIKHGSLEACFVKVELFLTWLCVFKIQRLWCKTLEKQDNTMAEKKILTFGNSTIYRFLKVLFARFLFFCYTNYLDLRAFLSKYWYMWWIAYSLQFWPKVVFSILQTLEGVRDFAREFPHKGSAYLVVFSDTDECFYTAYLQFLLTAPVWALNSQSSCGEGKAAQPSLSFSYL